MQLPALSQSRALRRGVFFLLYFRQGLPAGFASTALANTLTARGVAAETVGDFVALTGLPWTLQFVWGPVIDRFQGSAMGRRRPWILGAQLFGLAACLPLLAVDDPAARLGLISWTFLVHSVVASVQDTGVDAMAISAVPDGERGRVNAFMRAGFIVGMGAGAMLSIVMAAQGFRSAAALQIFALALITLVTFLVRERPGDTLLPFRPRPGGVNHTHIARLSTRAIVIELARGLLGFTSLRLFLPVAASYLAASVFIRALSIHLIRDAGWGDAELSTFSGGAGTLMALAVVAAGGWLSDRVGHRRLLSWVLCVLAVYLLSFAALGPWWSSRSLTRPALAAWYAFDPLLSVAAMPALMALCRPGVEGSQFTAYMALVNLCDVLGSHLAGRALGVVTAPSVAAGCGLIVLLASVSSWRRSRPAPQRLISYPPTAGGGDFDDLSERSEA